MEEIWRDVIGYEGLYKISNQGKILSVKRNKIMADSIHRDGYMKVHLSKDGKKKTYQVHRLVALSFIPNPLNKPQVNHINGVKDDNYVENLEWSTARENGIHAYKNGLSKGHNGNQNKVVQKIDIKTNKIIETYNSVTELAKIYNTYRNKFSSVLDKDVELFGFYWKTKNEKE